MAKQNGNGSLSEWHSKFQADRRKLEQELLGIDDAMKDAICDGDADRWAALEKRKRELPALFLQASKSETKARRELFNAEDQENSKRLRAAEDERNCVRTALEKRQQEIEAELAAMRDQLQEAEARVDAASAALASHRNLGGSADAAFKKSLAQLAGI